MKSEYEQACSIILAGATGTGKTSISNFYLSKQVFDKNISSQNPQIFEKVANINGKMTKIQIIDLPGTEPYRSIEENYLKFINGVFMVYDITNYSTYRSITTWYRSLSDEQKKNSVFFLTGNKLDLDEQRQVKPIEALKFAKEFEIEFMEVCASEGYLIDDIFRKILKEIDPEKMREIKISRSLDVTKEMSSQEENKQILVFEEKESKIEDSVCTSCQIF